MKAKIILLLGVAVVVVGCGQHPVDEFETISNDVADEACMCPDIVARYSNEAACIAELSFGLNETQKQCFKDAYDRNESVASGTFDCTLDEAKAFRDCVANASCNTAALTSCLSAFDIEGDCPALPPSVQAEFDACGG